MVLLCSPQINEVPVATIGSPLAAPGGKRREEMAQLLLTEHARIRMIARKIPTTAVEMALLFGREKHIRGATFYAVGRREVNWFGLNGVNLRRFEGIQVICA